VSIVSSRAQRASSLLLLIGLLGGAAVADGAGPARRAPVPGSGQGRASTYRVDTSLAAMTAIRCAAGVSCVNASGSGAMADDGGDDHAALTAAVAKVAPGRGTVFVPAGTYLLSQPLYLPTGVTLAGAGLTRTRLLLSWASLANFSYNYLIAPAGGAATDVTVRDLTVDGGRRRTACLDGESSGSCHPNHGGGVTVGSRWTVRQVRFTGMNYFKLWICGVADVKLVDNRWDNLGADIGAGGEDNIGGGCGARGVVITGNSFHESIVGNVINLTRASFVSIAGNTSERNSIIFEGVTDSSIMDSTVVRGDINVISNGRYDSSTTFGNYNPARITVARNTIDRGEWGININYSNRDGATNHPGGANTVTQNRIQRTSQLGILVTSCHRGAKTTPDTVDRNVIVDANSAGTESYNSGCASFEPVGIGLGAGAGDRITDNRVVDTRTPPQTVHAISVGDLVVRHPVSGTVLTGNDSTGLAGRTIRYAGRALPP